MIQINLSETIPLDSIPFITKFNISSILPSQSVIWDSTTSTFIPYTPLFMGDITPLLNNKANVTHTHTVSAITDLTLAGVMSINEEIKTQDFISVKNSIYFINTSTNPVYITLPDSPVNGDKISFIDYLMPSGFSLNPITLVCSSPISILGTQSYMASQSIHLIFFDNKWFAC